MIRTSALSTCEDAALDLVLYRPGMAAAEKTLKNRIEIKAQEAIFRSDRPIDRWTVLFPDLFSRDVTGSAPSLIVSLFCK